MLKEVQSVKEASGFELLVWDGATSRQGRRTQAIQAHGQFLEMETPVHLRFAPL